MRDRHHRNVLLDGVVGCLVGGLAIGIIHARGTFGQRAGDVVEDGAHHLG